MFARRERSTVSARSGSSVGVPSWTAATPPCTPSAYSSKMLGARKPTLALEARDTTGPRRTLAPRAPVTSVKLLRSSSDSAVRSFGAASCSRWSSRSPPVTVSRSRDHSSKANAATFVISEDGSSSTGPSESVSSRDASTPTVPSKGPAGA